MFSNTVVYIVCDSCSRISYIMQRDPAHLQPAVEAYKAQKQIPRKKRASQRKVAALHDVASSTLNDRISGKHLARSESHSHLQLVTPGEEEVLVDYIRRMASYGFPAAPTVIQEVASLIHQNRHFNHFFADSTDPATRQELD